MPVLAYFDVLILLVAAPVMLLIGVPAAGYLVAAAVWIALRALEVAVIRYSDATPDPSRAMSARLGFLLGRLFTLAIAVVLVRNGSGRDAGLAALAVIVFAFTAEMVISAATRPRRSR